MMKSIIELIKTWCGWVYLFLVVSFMSSCATAPSPDKEVELALAEAKTACYASQTATATNDKKLVDPRDILLGKAIDALAKAVDKGVDPCASIVTNNDLQKVAMEENTKQIVAAVDGGKSVAGNAVVGFLGWKFLDVAPVLFGGAGKGYNLTSGGDMTLTDSLKTSTVGDVFGASSLGGVLNNPVSSIAPEPLVAGVVQ